MTIHQSQISSHDELLARLAKLEAENAKLKAGRAQKLTLKVSEKGAVALYGMGMWPVTLYRTQWERVIAHVDEIKAFIEANADRLTSKD